MRALLLITAGFLALSGGLKVRSTQRLGLGLTPMTLLELVAAVALALMMMPSPLNGTPVERWSVPVAVAVLVASSTHHALRLRRYRQQRAETEGGRLARYVKYLSEAEGQGGAGEAPGSTLDPEGGA